MPGSQLEDVVSNTAVLHDDPISSLVIRCAERRIFGAKK